MFTKKNVIQNTFKSRASSKRTRKRSQSGRRCVCGLADCQMAETAEWVKPPNGKGCAEVVKTWGRALLGEGCNAGALDKFVERSRKGNVYIHARHWRVKDFRMRNTSRKLKEERAPTLHFRMTMAEAKSLLQQLALRVATPKKARKKSVSGPAWWVCACGHAACSQNLGVPIPGSGKVLIPSNMRD